MFQEFRPFFAEINLDHFRNNFCEVKRSTKGKKTIGIIKADGYGHGAVELAQILNEENADYFGVAVISEAIELRRAGFENPILILGYTPPFFIKELVKYNITQTVFDLDTAKAISSEAQRQNKIAKVHIKIDTGMGRIGYLPGLSAIKEILEICGMKNLVAEGIFSHFSNPDAKDKSFAYAQMQKYVTIIEELKTIGVEFELKHIANSAAIIDLPETYFNCVRPGIMLYGYYPSNEVDVTAVQLKPVMSLKANIVHIKELQSGTPISYGCTFITKRRSRIATLPFGYADGFSRLYYGKASVIAGNQLAPVVGRICMDQCMIDITDCDSINTGDEVIVMGESNGININADYHANLLGTISYEILCMVSRRVPRIYYQKDEIVKVKNYV